MRSAVIGAAFVVGVAAACTSPASTSLQGAATTDVSVAPTGDIAHLTAVRLTPEAGHDRLELQFADRVPGYTVGYRSLPAHADASGFEIPLPGATAMVQITLTPATGEGWGGTPRTYLGPAAVSADTVSVAEVKAAGDFEAVVTWVAGLRARVPFQVLVLEEPPRLVVDFAS